VNTINVAVKNVCKKTTREINYKRINSRHISSTFTSECVVKLFSTFEVRGEESKQNVPSPIPKNITLKNVLLKFDRAPCIATRGIVRDNGPTIALSHKDGMLEVSKGRRKKR